MVSAPVVIVVSGPSAAGKTTMASKIASEFRLPFVGKDAIKETLFDTLGWDNRCWSKELGLASVMLMFGFVESQLEAGKSVVVEANFYKEFDTERFRNLKERFDCEIVQVYCTAKQEVLLSRFLKRWESGDRHPGHGEATQIEDFKTRLAQGVWDAVPIDGRTIVVDTSDFERVSYEDLFRQIRTSNE